MGPPRLCLKVRNLAWTQSVPPRGSGWVHAQLFGSERVYDVPTRYREVVLTVSKHISLPDSHSARGLCCSNIPFGLFSQIHAVSSQSPTPSLSSRHVSASPANPSGATPGDNDNGTTYSTPTNRHPSPSRMYRRISGRVGSNSPSSSDGFSQ